jgi:hypothetical protein
MKTPVHSPLASSMCNRGGHLAYRATSRQRSTQNRALRFGGGKLTVILDLVVGPLRPQLSKRYLYAQQDATVRDGLDDSKSTSANVHLLALVRTFKDSS